MTFDVCLMPFAFAHVQPAKPSKTIVFTMNLHVSTHQKNMIFDDLHDLIRYQFGRRFLMSVGIDVGSILVSFWHKIPCCWVILLFDVIFNRSCIDFE